MLVAFVAMVLAAALWLSCSSGALATCETTARSMEREVFRSINEHRAGMGLKPLRWEEQLAMVCRLYSTEMASRDVYGGHSGIDFRGAMVVSLVECQSYRENIGMAMNVTAPSSRVVSSWLESPGHRRNIESDATITGVGVSRSESGAWFFVQIFVRDNTYFSGEEIWTGRDDPPPEIADPRTVRPY